MRACGRLVNKFIFLDTFVQNNQACEADGGDGHQILKHYEQNHLQLRVVLHVAHAAHKHGIIVVVAFHVDHLKVVQVVAAQYGGQNPNNHYQEQALLSS